MAFKLFKKYCPVCKQEVEKDHAIFRFGKYFCSSDHAEEFRKELAKEESKRSSGDSCCG